MPRSNLVESPPTRGRAQITASPRFRPRAGSRRAGRKVPGQPSLVSRPVARKDRTRMTHTVCEPCHDCKYTDCVVVCPVECFYQDETMLYIDPVDCIDCEAGVPECPVEAIDAEAN